MNPLWALTAINGISTASNMFSDPAQEQYQYSLDLMDKQYEINRKAMQDQTAAGLYMFEKTGYGAKVKQLKDAGLNPGLIYSMGAAGGGTTGNISAPSVSGQNAPNMAQIQANKTANVGMALELAKLQSEIDVNKSVAAANQATAAEKTANVPKIGQETANLKQTFELIGQQIQSEQIKQAGWSIDNDLSKIELEIKEKTKFLDIDRIGSLSREANISFLKSIEEWHSARAKAKVDEATVNTAINTYNARLENIMADTFVAKSQGKLNQEKAIQVVNQISQDWMNTKTAMRNADINQQALEQRIWETLQNNSVELEKTDLQGLYRVIESLIPTTVIRK